MFGYIRAIIASTFDHPLLASLYIVSGVLAVLGALLEFIIQPFFGSPGGVPIAFFAVYAIFIATIATVGYAIIYLVRFLSKTRDRMGPASGS